VLLIRAEKLGWGPPAFNTPCWRHAAGNPFRPRLFLCASSVPVSLAPVALPPVPVVEPVPVVPVPLPVPPDPEGRVADDAGTAIPDTIKVAAMQPRAQT
jgi:hypothetical protein